jgi:hypothetical protein
MISIDFPGSQGYRVSAGYPDDRGAPYLQFPDGGGYITVIVQVEIDLFPWQLCLVEYPDLITQPLDGFIIGFNRSYLPDLAFT